MLLKEPYSPANGDPTKFLEEFRKAHSATGFLPTGEDIGSVAG